MGPLLVLSVAAIASLAGLLLASELMVRELSTVGERLELPEPVLGLLIALGADAPEISTALIALLAGSQEIGLGVVEGSNLYNLAGLLGLSAVLAGPLFPSRHRIVYEGGSNLSLTIVVILLVLLAPIRIALALVTLAAFLLYLWRLVRRVRPPAHHLPLKRPLFQALAATAGVVGCSALLVNLSISLIHQLNLTEVLVGVFILPIVTSLPNTWAALSLARRELGDAVIATAFASNSINMLFGIAAPALFLQLHPTVLERALDGPYLVGMTLILLILLYTGRKLARREGVVIILLYLAFVVIRLTRPG